MRQPRQVIARRHFRNYAAEFFVVGNLRRHFARQHLTVAQNRYSSLVAGRFDCENCHEEKMANDG
jgi:hypothetical protein